MVFSGYFMDRLSERPRPSRRAVMLGGLASIAFGSKSRAWGMEQAVAPTKALILLAHLDEKLNSLSYSDRDMNRLIQYTRMQAPVLVSEEERTKVAAFAVNRIRRNAIERVLLRELRLLKSWDAPNTQAVALAAVNQIENDEIICREHAARAHVDRFLQKMGIKAVA